MASRCACNTRVIADVNSNPPLAYEKLLQWDLVLKLTSYKYSYHTIPILISRDGSISLRKIRVITCAAIENMRWNCKFASNYRNVSEWVEVAERNKVGPSLPLLSRESLVCERKPRQKVTKYYDLSWEIPLDLFKDLLFHLYKVFRYAR